MLLSWLCSWLCSWSCMSRYVARAMKSVHTPRPNSALCSLASFFCVVVISLVRVCSYQQTDVLLGTIQCYRTRVTKALVKVHLLIGNKIRRVLPLGRYLNNWIIKFTPSQRFIDEDWANGICGIRASACTFCFLRLFLPHSRRA